MRLARAPLWSLVAACLLSMIVVVPAWAGDMGVANTSGFGALNATLAPNTWLGVNASSTSAGVDDGTGGCTPGDFCFGASTTTFAFNNAALPAGNQITFYLQSSLAPDPGTSGAQDGGVKKARAPGHWLHRLPVAEPASLALYGSGLALVGVMIRRRGVLRTFRP
jgi:hypothetical protein